MCQPANVYSIVIVMYTDLVLDIDLYNCRRPQLMFDVLHKMSAIFVGLLESA